MYNFATLKSNIDGQIEAGIADCLPHIYRGLEKESLRQNSNGKLSQKPHPENLGSALTNSYITTDYSEALLEFITPVFKEADCLLEFLYNLHSFAVLNMDNTESL